jgi:excinuclease ABC subunit C
LLELSQKNASEFKFQNLKQDALKNPEHKSVSVEMLKKDLHLQNSPVHIECFDNSNIQGTNPVASCVVFKNGRPSKKDYRKFNIKSVVGANDFASMYEVVFRRYSRLLEEEGELPQLIVVDGGKGQLDFAYKALTDLNLNKKIPIIGIAKRLEELIIPGDPTPLFLDKNSPGLKLIMQLRDEAHRFGITFHRLKRSKGQINSELRDIKGIGEETEKKLLQRYKSVARIRELSEEELTDFAGAKVAQAIKSHFESHL